MKISQSLLEYIQDIKDGNTTCQEFTHQILEHAKKHEPKYHAYLSLNNDAINHAIEIDKKIKSGDAGLLYGAPISVKDNICVKDTTTTCASKMLENFTSPYDATVISKLKQNHAVILGKTNLDEFAMGITTEFSAFGPSKNPWNSNYVPGGSSGGSAVAVSAFESLAALGSDTGGSIRNPASFCSVVGYKPTFGLVSRYGLVSYANSIEQIGPITRTVKDAALMLNVISGHDIHDNTTISAPQDYLKDIDVGLEGKKIGIVKQMMGDGISQQVKSAASTAISKLESLGATTQEIHMDTVDYSVAAYYIITAAEAGSNLARYDNLRYGYDFSHEGYEFNSYISKARSKFGPEVTRRMILGGFVPSAGQAGRYYLKAMKVKSKLTSEINDSFKKVDLLFSPTVPVMPFKLGEKIDDPVALFLVDFNTVTSNLTGIPAISIPFKITDGLPIGMQLMAKHMDDKSLLQAAHSLESTVSLPEVPL